MWSAGTVGRTCTAGTHGAYGVSLFYSWSARRLEAGVDGGRYPALDTDVSTQTAHPY